MALYLFSFLFQVLVIVLSLLAFVAYILLVPASLYLQKQLFLCARRFIRARSTSHRPGLFPWLGMLGANLDNLSHVEHVPASGGVMMFGGTAAHILLGWPFPWLGFPNLLASLATPIMFALTTLYWSAFTCMSFVLAVAILTANKNKWLHPPLLLLVAWLMIGLSFLLPALHGPACWQRIFLTPCRSVAPGYEPRSEGWPALPEPQRGVL